MTSTFKLLRRKVKIEEVLQSRGGKKKTYHKRTIIAEHIVSQIFFLHFELLSRCRSGEVNTRV